MALSVRAFACALTLYFTASLLPQSAFAQSGRDAFKGKTLTLVIGTSSGGGYDTLGRIVARHLPDHLPVNSGVIVQNIPAAGSIVATNYLFNEAPRDGLTIGLVQNNAPFEPLLGTEQARYEAAEFNWLGSPTIETGVLAVWHTVPVNSIGDVQKHEITVGSVGAQSTPTLYARLLNEALGTKLKIIVGYPGQNEISLALQNGEVDSSLYFYSSLMAAEANLVKDGSVKLLVQYGLKKEPAMGDVPFGPDLVTSPDTKLLMQAGFAELAAGRPFLAPPGVPPDRISALRTALTETFSDPSFVAEANAANLGPIEPRTGAELAELIAVTYKTPAPIVEKLRNLYWK